MKSNIKAKDTEARLEMTNLFKILNLQDSMSDLCGKLAFNAIFLKARSIGNTLLMKETSIGGRSNDLFLLDLIIFFILKWASHS